MEEDLAFLLTGLSDSSTMLFHWPQSGHRPSHLGAWYVQLWQTNMDLFFLVICSLITDHWSLFPALFFFRNLIP